jgi:glucoamylase
MPTPSQRRTPSRSRPVRAAAAALAVTLAAGLIAARRPDPPAPLFTVGLLGNQVTLLGLGPAEAAGATYLDGSTVLRLPDGRLRYLPPGASTAVTVPAGDAGALAAAAAERAWLARGRLPGATWAEREAAARSLAFLRLLLRPGGAEVAAQPGYWAYVWPRDASFAAAAFAVTGHGAEARSILGFLARTQRPDGTWPARSRADGTPVADGRAPQLDATGWVPWAVWLASGQGADRGFARRLWPTVRAAADAAARSLDRHGLPPPGPDYWERTERSPTLGTAAALRTGLRAAADLAATLDPARARRWRARAATLGRAIPARFAGPGGYRHATGGGGPDAAVTWLAPPFAPATPGVRAALAAAARQLTVPGGGVVPGLRWRRGNAWTPATASFALAAAAGGDRTDADRLLGWLLAHRTTLGAFPERVRRADGQPRSVAPIAWTHALVLLALTARAQPLPIP